LSGRSEVSQKQVFPQKKPQSAFFKSRRCHMNCSPPEAGIACSVCTATGHASKNLKHLFSFLVYVQVLTCKIKWKL